MVAARWVEVVAVEASTSGSSDVGLESSVAASESESEALVLHRWPVHLEWLKNWLDCMKRGLTLLPEDCPENGTFLLPSFSISLILFSMTMALSTMCRKSA
jgi:hypothetical protein